MKKFSLTVTQDGDRVTIDCTNDGFYPLEIVGLLEWRKQDLMEQIQHPERYTRTVKTEDGREIAIKKEGE